MQGRVTGMEMLQENLSPELALNRGWTRALDKYQTAGIDLGNIKSHKVKQEQAFNQDALIVTVYVDSSLWTGRP